MIWFLTALGLAARFWNIHHGLPQIFYTDEGHYTYFALNMGGGDLNPRHFFHPSFYFYLCFAADLAFIAFGMITGLFQRPGEAWALYKTDPAIFYALGRAVSAVFGTLTIPLTYWIGRRVAGERAALWAALFLCFAFLHIQYSQIGNMDVTLAFFVLTAFAFAWLAFERGRLRYFILSGLAGGLAASTKYQGFETFLWGPLACVMMAHREKRNLLFSLGSRRSLFFCLFFILGFTLATPYWILDFGQFRQDFLWTWNYYKMSGKGQLGYEGNWNWGYYLAVLSSYGAGLPLTLFGFLGLLWLAVRGGREGFFFAAFPAVYFIISGISTIRTARYMMPLLPFLCIAAAYVMMRLSECVPAKNPFLKFLFSAGLGLVLLAPNVANTLRYHDLRMRPDTRLLAHQWLKDHVPQNAPILQTAYAFLPEADERKLQALDPTVFNTRVENLSSLKPLAQYRLEGFQYLVMDEWHQGMVLEEGSRDPQYAQTVQNYRQFLEDLEASGKMLAAFSPYRETGVRFDMENVEVPSRFLSKMKRTGPEVRIYQL